MTLKVCPLCGGELYPHCHPRSSKACDLVTCRRCGHSGSLDGRWWGRDGNHYRGVNVFGVGDDDGEGDDAA